MPAPSPEMAMKRPTTKNTDPLDPETYVWPADELARFKDYVGDAQFAAIVAAEKLNGAAAATAMIGHNSIMVDIPSVTHGASFTAPRSLDIVSLNGLRRAIRDDELDRGHLKVLANLTERFNEETYTAWPKRERIADEEGLEAK